MGTIVARALLRSTKQLTTSLLKTAHPRLNIIPHLLRPTRGGAAGVLIVFAVLFSLAARAGYMGLPLAFILTSWFFKYAYILFDHTVRGFDEPSTLDIQMLNPLDGPVRPPQVRGRHPADRAPRRRRRRNVARGARPARGFSGALCG
jgi:hypothetical protein